MTLWPKWLRITFLISGCLFLLAVIFSVYVLASHTVIPPLSVNNPSHPSRPGEPGTQPTSLVNIITAITGLLTAASALYGKFLAGRKQKLDYELARQQMRMQARNAAPKKTNKRRKRGHADARRTT